MTLESRGWRRSGGPLSRVDCGDVIFFWNFPFRECNVDILLLITAIDIAFKIIVIIIVMIINHPWLGMVYPTYRTGDFPAGWFMTLDTHSLIPHQKMYCPCTMGWCHWCDLPEGSTQGLASDLVVRHQHSMEFRWDQVGMVMGTSKKRRYRRLCRTNLIPRAQSLLI